MALFFTGDTHFRDPRVMRIDRRPFESVEDHDAHLMAFWNETVREDDEIWHLGDFARGSIAEIAGLLSRLNGQKHLIRQQRRGADVEGPRMVERPTLQGTELWDPAARPLPLSIPHLE
jgi:calcineurin-like phosphoesterase family protein